MKRMTNKSRTKAPHFKTNSDLIRLINKKILLKASVAFEQGRAQKRAEMIVLILNGWDASQICKKMSPSHGC